MRLPVSWMQVLVLLVSLCIVLLATEIVFIGSTIAKLTIPLELADDKTDLTKVNHSSQEGTSPI